jgi:hypothetical protein
MPSPSIRVTKDMVWAILAPAGMEADTMAGTEAKQGAAEAHVAIAVVDTVHQSLEDFPPSEGSLLLLEACRDFHQQHAPGRTTDVLSCPRPPVLSSTSRGGPACRNGASPTVFKYGKTSRKLECLLLMWLYHCQWSHEHYMPFPHA